MGDSTYQDLLKFAFHIGAAYRIDFRTEFYFGKGRGLLRSTMERAWDSLTTVMEPMDKQLPLAMTRPAR